MLSAARPIPLSRRLVSRYLAFALGGLLLCLVTMLFLAAHGALANLVSLAALGPLVVLLFGAVALHQTVRLNSAIENELRRLSHRSDVSLADMQPLAGDEPAIRGWNALLERFVTQESLIALEQRVTEALQRREDQQQSDVINSLPDGIAVTDKRGRVLLANNALRAGVSSTLSDDIDGQSLFQLLNASQAANAEEVRRTFSQPTGHAVAELHRSQKIEDGVWRISRNQIRSKGDEVRHVWTIRDVTQQSLVTQARNEFVSTATHELRTPLANIKAYAETLVSHDAIDVEQQKEFCNIINSEATRLSRFVDEVLNVSQIESGSFTLDLRETNLERLLSSVVEHVRPQMVQKEIDFTVKLPPKLPKLSVDKDKLQAALFNLLGNAAKYTPDGGAISFEVEAKPSHVAFHVQDTGIGIAEEELPRVFDKFYRSKDDRVKELSGNGLGLALTQEVVRLHGGRATVESTLNEGSRFTVTIPV